MNAIFLLLILCAFKGDQYVKDKLPKRSVTLPSHFKVRFHQLIFSNYVFKISNDSNINAASSDALCVPCAL